MRQWTEIGRRAVRLAAWVVMALAISSCEEACNTAKDVSEFVDSISDGAPCEADYQCLGGKCLTDQLGYPNGYCTTLRCEEEGCSGLYSECFRTTIDNREITACYEMCDIDGSCERADEGYTCVSLDGTAVCLPPNATSAPPQGSIGSPCSADPQCNGGEGAACLQNFFGGYCTVLACNAEGASCPGDNPCLALNPEADPADQKYGCLDACEADEDCRYGYACQDFQGASVCLEGERDDSPNPDGAALGAECVANLNCRGGTCIREREGAGGAVSYPGGYCARLDCSADDDCTDGVCVSRARSTACMASCTSDDDCREGYDCRETADGERSYCDSTVEPVAPDTTESGGGDSPFEITCQSSKSYSFEVPMGAVGFYVAPFTRANERVVPRTLTRPDGTTLDLGRDYDFLMINHELIGSLSPLLFPASDRNEFRDAFGPGTYTLEVQSNASEVCFYAIPQTARGTRLALNIYFVGVDGVDAASASGNRSIQRMVGTMQRIYSDMGVSVEVADYIDASSTVTENYRIIRDFYDVYDLVATSKAPSGGANAALSVNIFLIEGFNVSEAPGLLGVSAGLPGMAGVHGNSAAGLVFSAQSLGEDDSTLGQTMAHEVGHFLGLRHTTEHDGTPDPITDTPTCVTPKLGWVCSDAGNFMFPFSLGSGQDGTSDGQAFVVRRNPLIVP